MPALNAMKPSPALLAKLGSIIVHAEEGASVYGHAFDHEAVRALMRDSEVQWWLTAMRGMALLPVKRQEGDHAG